MPPEPKPSREQKPLQGRCDHCGSVPVCAEDSSVVRCDCGSLLARYSAGGLELKCRRCKRTLIVRTHETRPESATE